MYPNDIDEFTDKLNKIDNNVYVIEEEIQIEEGKYEGLLAHDNINTNSIKVYTGSKLTGEEIKNVIVSGISETPWKRLIKIYTSVSPVYVTYETQGDTVEAEDINKVQDSIVNTEKALNQETYRAEKVEQRIASDLEQEKNRAVDKENIISNQLNQEVGRAKEAEHNITNELNNEITRATEKEQVLSTSINNTNTNLVNEKNRAKEAEVNINKSIDSINNDLINEKDRAKTRESDIETDLDDYKGINNTEIQKLKEKDIEIDNKKAAKTYVDSELNKRYLKQEIFTKEEVLRKIQDVIGTAPEALDTLSEIAKSLNNDADFAGTITNQLSKKVDKAQGKALSDENYTGKEKDKLAGIETNANKYVHPSKHTANVITQDSSHRFVNDNEKINWNDANSKKHQHDNKAVIDSLSQAIIDKWNSKAEGVHTHTKNEVGLDKVDNTTDLDKPVSKAVQTALNKKANSHSHPYLPLSGGKLTGNLTIADGKKLVFMDSNGEGMAMDSNGENWRLFEPEDGNKTWLEFKDDDGLYVLGQKASLVNHNHNKTYEPKNDNIQAHIKTAHAPSNAQKNSDITKGEIEAKLRGNITSHSHNPNHIHSNKSVLDKISMSGTESGFDLSHFVTNDDLGNAGYGDMLKSVYDKNGNGKVDKAEKADSVTWTGVSGKPSKYSPSSHTHLINDMNYRTIDFYVEGKANTYYPVVLSGISDYGSSGLPSKKYFELIRGYSWTAPNTWNTSTHKGGLQIYMDTYAYGWGGMNYFMEFSMAQLYSKMVADIRIPEPDTNLIIFWLRGGHALYRIIAYDKDIAITAHIGDFVHKKGTKYEKTHSPRTSIEPVYNFVGGDFRKFSTIDYQYIGGSYRDPKNGSRVWTAKNLNPNNYITKKALTWNQLKGVY